MAHQRPLKAVALMGATGTGKSALALNLAAEQDNCIISCDSMQLYRGLDIGTSKASALEQQQVRHALINCADIEDVWNAQRWANAALALIEAENKQGKTPLIVGGTGLYLKALTQGFADVPAETEGVRQHFEAIQQVLGTAHLHLQLQAVDAPLAARLEPQDTQRIIRGLSVFESTGVPLSVWQAKQSQVKKDAEHQLACPVFVLELPRDVLRQRIAVRFQQMMDVGWLAECQWLLALQLPDTHPVMRAVGYRQLLNHLNGVCTLEQAVEDGITATRRYAKRQRTWFNNQTPNAIRGNSEMLFDGLRQQITR